MSQSINLLSVRAVELAKEMRDYLSQRFRIAVRLRKRGEGKGFRLLQVRKACNRHLVAARPVAKLPRSRKIDGQLVMAPAELVASKVVAFHQRRGKPKSGTDWRDLAMLLLAFPELKAASGPLVESLKSAGVDAKILEVWQEVVAQDIQPPAEDDES